MGVLGNVISVGPNGPLVGASSKRWLGDVITEGPDGPLLGPSAVVNIYIYYVYFISICGNVGEILIRLIGR